MLERQKRMMEKIDMMLKDGQLLSSVLFGTSEVMNILYEGHIWFVRMMDGEPHDLCDLQNEKHLRPTVDYTHGKMKRYYDQKFCDKKV